MIDRLYPLARSLYRQALRWWSRLPNLEGDRDVENTFVIQHMPAGPGQALDFGANTSFMSLMAARRGFSVIALDIMPIHFLWAHPKIETLQGDVLTTNFPEDFFDLIINLSTVEHVGLAGRYGVKKMEEEGDLIAMKRLRLWLKSEGVMLLTIPVGRDAVFIPMNRVYGEKRLPLLLEGYRILHEEYWAKRGSDNIWYQVEKAEALSFPARAGSRSPFMNIYALGCFALQKA
ncbi:MAG: DUF268 domain-containing protein [Bacteroidia bacterium]|nr:DUF268 domain-containing protein [Bacteroidia bacterium]MDW8015587.1 DUF268 domain-containing protein [Bacteroidia bacterium]